MNVDLVDIDSALGTPRDNDAKTAMDDAVVAAPAAADGGENNAMDEEDDPGEPQVRTMEVPRWLSTPEVTSEFGTIRPRIGTVDGTMPSGQTSTFPAAARRSSSGPGFPSPQPRVGVLISVAASLQRRDGRRGGRLGSLDPRHDLSPRCRHLERAFPWSSEGGGGVFAASLETAVPRRCDRGPCPGRRGSLSPLRPLSGGETGSGRTSRGPGSPSWSRPLSRSGTAFVSGGRSPNGTPRCRRFERAAGGCPGGTRTPVAAIQGGHLLGRTRCRGRGPIARVEDGRLGAPNPPRLARAARGS